MATHKKLKVHPSLEGKETRLGARGGAAKSSSKFTEIEGYIAPSVDEGVVEIWEDLGGSSRVSVAEKDIIECRQDEDGFTTLRVNSDTPVRHMHAYISEENASFLSGELITKFNKQLAAAVGLKKPKKPPKYCKTKPILVCGISAIVVVTTTVCTLTWPCDTDDDDKDDDVFKTFFQS